MENRPSTIDEVLVQLDQIIEESSAENNYLGVFAYVYRRTTAQIKTEIEKGRFEDNARMEKFDVLFANYYIDAYKAYRANLPHPRCWATSFDAAQQPLAIMQHLLMGMNAHITHDLGIAAAKFAPGEQIKALEKDFMLVNDILQELTDEMQLRVAKVSPLLFLLDCLGKKKDEQIANFSIVKARQLAWNLACTLAPLNAEAEKEVIAQTDRMVTKLSKLIKAPKSRISRWVLHLVRRFEEKDILTIINTLKA